MLRFMNTNIPFFTSQELLDTQPLFGPRIISFNSWVHYSRYLQQYPHLIIIKIVEGGIDIHLVYHIPYVASLYIVIPLTPVISIDQE